MFNRSIERQLSKRAAPEVERDLNVEVDEASSGLVAERRSFLRKLAEAPRAGRTLLSLASFLAVGSIVQFARWAESEAKAESAYYEGTRQLVLDSSFNPGFDIAPAQEKIEFDGEEVERFLVHRDLDKIGTQVIKNLATDANGNPTFYNMMKEICGETNADGEEGLDLVKCADAYNSQMPLSKTFDARLTAVTGLDLEEREIRHAMLDHSIFEKPDVISFGGPTFTGMSYAHGYGEVPSNFRGERDNFFDAHYRDAADLSSGVIKTLNLEKASETEQDEAIKAVRQVVSAEIDFKNAFLDLERELEFFDEEPEMAAKAIIEGGISEETGEKYAARIDNFLQAQQRLEGVWGKLMSLEDDSNGPLHQKGMQVLAKHRISARNFMQQARETGLEKFWQEQSDTQIKEIPDGIMDTAEERG